MRNWIELGLTAGRRGFLKGMSVAAAMAILGIRGASTTYAQIKDYLTSRIDASYRHDRTMKYRKSQDNPAVKRLYSECLAEPMCHKAETLLHTEYFDRSESVRGLK